jgi:hypothetical protein
MKQGKRHSKVEKALSNILDNNKFKITIRPNYIHALDSSLAW